MRSEYSFNDDEKGTIHEVDRVLVAVQYEIVEEFIPFKLHSYATGQIGEQIADAAVADINLGGIRGKIMIVYKENEGGKVVFVPEKNTEPA